MTKPNDGGGKVLLYLEELHVGQRFLSGTHPIDEEQIKAFGVPPVA
jgi:hypothetical protein